MMPRLWQGYVQLTRPALKHHRDRRNSVVFTVRAPRRICRALSRLGHQLMTSTSAEAVLAFGRLQERSAPRAAGTPFINAQTRADCIKPLARAPPTSYRLILSICRFCFARLD